VSGSFFWWSLNRRSAGEGVRETLPTPAGKTRQVRIQSEVKHESNRLHLMSVSVERGLGSLQFHSVCEIN